MCSRQQNTELNHTENVLLDEIVDAFITAMSCDEEQDQISGVKKLLEAFYKGGPFDEFARKIVKSFDFRESHLVLPKTDGSSEKLARWDEENKKYVDVKKNKIKLILARLMFKYIKDEMYFDKENPPENWGGIDSIEENRLFKIFYTRRVSSSELQQFGKVCQAVAKIMTDGMLIEKVRRKAVKDITVYCAEAINRLKKVTSCTGDYTDYPTDWAPFLEIIKKVSDVMDVLWREGRRIEIYCDNVGIDSIYGTSTNNGSTPDMLMGEDKSSIINVPGFISINFAACSDEMEMYKTLYHEMAHLIGFNPTDVDGSGHFSDISHYAEDEEIKDIGNFKKILFDAYFFETVMTLD